MTLKNFIDIYIKIIKPNFDTENKRKICNVIETEKKQRENVLGNSDS